MNNSDDAAASWLDLFEVTSGHYSHIPATQDIHRDLMSAPQPQYLFTAGASLPNFNTTIDTSFTPAYTGTTSMEAFSNPTTLPNHTYPGVPDAWPTLAQAFFDVNTIATQPVWDYQWTGISPLAPNSAVATPNVVGSGNITTLPSYQDDPLAWLFRQDVPSFSSGWESETGLVPPEYDVNISGVTTYPVEWATNEVALPFPGGTSAPTAPTRKRCREEGASHSGEGRVVIDAQDIPPRKRARGGTSYGIQKSAARTSHKPADMVPKQVANDRPKEVKRGAERLANTNSQGLYRQPLPGPSFQQGWAAGDAGGHLIGVEGSVEPVPVQQEDGHFKFPRTFKVAHQALLAATQADWDRGTIREIRCRLCPDTKLKSWEEFKRHCDTKEAHPLKISFCDHCGDFFARGDSLERHRKNPPQECRRVTPDKAEAKRRETEEAHKEFTVRLKEFWRTGEGIGKPFSQIIKDKYPDSSKKNKIKLTGRSK